jgi:HlyD family secretion protein
MKRAFIILLVLVLVAGALGAGWWAARTYPEQVVRVLASGGLDESRAEEFVALVASLGQGRIESRGEEPLVASGSIEGETVAVVAEFGGQIVALNAQEGGEVLADQMLVQLDTRELEAQVSQARAAVAAAKANLENVEAGTHPAEILTARAALHQAIAQRDAAETTWKDMQAVLNNPQEIDAQIVEAKTAIEVAETKIEQGEAQRALAEAERFKYRAQGTLEEKKLYVSFDYQVQAAQAAMDAARAEKRGAQATLAALRALRNHPLALTSRLHAAEAQYEIAAAGVGVANARLDELKAGPTSEALAVARAQVRQAEAAVAALETQMEKLTLRSPMDGIVTSLSAHAGEAAIPGTTLLTIANLDQVKLTIYVPETDLDRVYLGQEVEVQVDSFPGRVFTGTVSHISQQAEFTPKNVQTEKERVNMVFAVKVRLPNSERLLKPGMPADAVIGGEGSSE